MNQNLRKPKKTAVEKYPKMIEGYQNGEKLSLGIHTV